MVNFYPKRFVALSEIWAGAYILILFTFCFTPTVRNRVKCVYEYLTSTSDCHLSIQ